MKKRRIWLIVNGRSGSTNEDVVARTRHHIESPGARVDRLIDLAGGPLPGPGDDPPDIIASLGGDGTANAVIDHYGRDDRLPLLILPGGTMNLLAKRLHGETASVPDIVDAALGGRGEERAMPLLDGGDFTSLVGIIAGPVSAWGDVRENLREGGIGALVETVQLALSETFDGEPIRVAGVPGDYRALFIAPEEDALHASVIHAEGTGELMAHGWAWLNRDFLGGPTEEIGRGRRFELLADTGAIGLLVDGERRKAAAPLQLKWGRCPARFLATAHPAGPPDADA